MFTVFYTNLAGAETSTGPYCTYAEAEIAVAELKADGYSDFRVCRDFNEPYVGWDGLEIY